MQKIALIFLTCFILAGCDASTDMDTKSSDCIITSFAFKAGVNPVLDTTVHGSVNNTSIEVTVPFGTPVDNLIPDIVYKGESIDPAVETAQDFTCPVQYTVTAEDGSTSLYTVSVSVAASHAKEIVSFKFSEFYNSQLDATVTADITGTTISAAIPYGVNLNGLVPSIAISGVSVSPGSGVVWDFSNPVTYTVTAADGSEMKYTVSVTVVFNNSKDITSFEFKAGDNAGFMLDSIGTISDSVIEILVEPDTDRSQLTPSISISGKSVTPGSGIAQNFTSPVNYTVTADDGLQKHYTVTVLDRPQLTVSTVPDCIYLNSERKITFNATNKYGNQESVLVESSDTSIATVSVINNEAIIFGKREGTAIISFRSASGVKRTYEVTVYTMDNVYVAGVSGESYNTYQACYWVGNRKVAFDASPLSSHARDIIVEGKDVYVVGCVSNSQTAIQTGCYWKNGTRYDLEDNTNTSYASTVDVSNGVLYIGGYHKVSDAEYVLCYWKIENGVKTRIDLMRSGKVDTVEKIKVHNGNVYATGSVYHDTLQKYRPYLWINGENFTAIDLEGGNILDPARAYDMEILDNVVYIVGRKDFRGSGTINAWYWTYDGSTVNSGGLDYGYNNLSWATDMTVEGAKIYILELYKNGYWDSLTGTVIPVNYPDAIFHTQCIGVDQNNIYIGGNLYTGNLYIEGKDHAIIIKNNMHIRLDTVSTESEVFAMYIKK